MKPIDQPKPVLGLFDMTNLVVGAVIGADIYVVASQGAAYLGPAILVVWILGGVLAAIIAISFVQCAVIVPRVGGPYTYTREAFGPFPAFVVGWALYVGEWLSLAIFPIAFVRYLGFFFPEIPMWASITIKVLFVAFVTGTNLIGTRIGGTVNDLLTVAKLTPLLLLILGGVIALFVAPNAAIANLTPFVPFGWDGFGPALIVVFWAYAGFELATMPAAEVINAKQTMPRAFFRGMAIVTFFYILVNFVVVTSIPTTDIVQSQIPLSISAEAIAQTLGISSAIGGVILTVGALFSISGVDESISLGTSRLSYAMSADGYLPHFFGKLHPRFGTPYLGLLFQGATALGAALVGDLGGLITTAVVTLSIAYIATSLAAFRLVRHNPDCHLHIPCPQAWPLASALVSLFLLIQAGLYNLLIGGILIVSGIPIYLFLAPKHPHPSTSRELLSRKNLLDQVLHTGRVFLAGFLLFLSWSVKRLRQSL